MRQRTRTLLAWVLTVCMVISMLPVSVFATETTVTEDTTVTEEVTTPTESTKPTKVETKDITVSAKTWPEGVEKPGDVTIRIANVYLPRYSQMSIRMEVTGPDSNTNYTAKYTFPDGSTTSQGASYSSDVDVFTFNRRVDSYTPDSSYTFSMELTANSNDITYETATLTTHLASHESFPVSYDQIMEVEGVEYINVAEETINPDVYYAPGGVLDDYNREDLTLKIVKDGVVYAAGRTDDSPYINGPYYEEDPRYEGLFRDPNYAHEHTYEYKQMYMNLYRSRALEVGSYDVQVCKKATGEVLYTATNALEVVDKPVVSFSTYLNYSNLGNLVGGTTAYVQLRVSGGQQNEFSVKMYDEDGVLMGTSNASRTIDDQDNGFWAVYYVPLKDGRTLEPNVKYSFEVDYEGTDFICDSNTTLRLSNYPNFNYVSLASYYFANFLVQISNCKLDTSYKFELQDNYGQVLGTAFAYPDENGTCDVAFVNDDGSPVALEPDGNYQVYCFYLNDRGVWQQSGSHHLGNYYLYSLPEVAAAVSEEGTGSEPIVMNGSDTRAHGNCEDGQFNGNLYIYANDDDNYSTFANIEGHQFSVRMVNVAGGDPVEIPLTYDGKDRPGNYVRYYLYGTLPDDLEDGYYYFELYHNGSAMVDTDGNNLMENSYPSMPYRLPGMSEYNSDWQGLAFITEFDPDNAGTFTSMRTDFYARGNNSVTPDYSHTWSGSNYELTEDILSNLDLSVPYFFVSYIDGKLVGSSIYYRYLMPYSTYDYYDDGGTVPVHNVSLSESAMAAEHGSFTLVSPFTGTSGQAPDYTEVFIHAVPDEGYRLKPGSLKVNGKSILGRSFLAVEDAVVTGEFELAPVKKYSVSFGNASNGSLSLVGTKTEFAAGETVTVTLVPDEGYKASPWSKPYYYFNGNTTLTDNGDGTWSFVMPAGNVTVYGYFQKLSTSTIRLSNLNLDTLESYTFTDEDGNVITPSSTKITEGTLVYVDVSVLDGYILDRIYYDDVTLEATDTAGQYSFVMPDFSPYIYFEVTEKVAYPISEADCVNGSFTVSGNGSAYPGDTVTVTPSPNTGYLVDEVYYEDADGSQNTIHKDASGAYTFTMPNGEVTVYCTFKVKPAVECPTTLSVSDVTIPSSTSGAGDISMRIANIYTKDPWNDGAAIRLEFTAPASEEGYRLYFPNDDVYEYTNLHNGVYTAFYWVENPTFGDEFSFPVQITNDSTGASYSATLTTYLADEDQFIPTTAQLNPKAEIHNVDTKNIYTYRYLPTNSPLLAYNESDLSAKLVKDGTVYAVTLDDEYVWYYESSTQDSRYAGLFRDSEHDRQHNVLCYEVGSEFYYGIPLVTGKYDIQYCEKSTGKVICTVEDALELTASPLVELGSMHFNYSDPDIVTMWVDVEGARNPGDLTIKLYDKAGNLAATSGKYRPTSSHGNGFNADFEFSADNLEPGVNYHAEVIWTGGDVIVNYEDKLFVSIGAFNSDLCEFASHYYANVVFRTNHQNTDSLFRFELIDEESDEALLSTVYASPDENGLFNLEFKGTDGKILSIEPQHEYRMKVYIFDGGEWMRIGSSMWLNNYRVEPYEMAAAAAAETVMTASDYDWAGASIDGTYLDASIEISPTSGMYSTFANAKNAFSIRMTNILGTTTIVPMTTEWNERSDYVDIFLTAAIPTTVTEGYYYLELLHNGVDLVDSDGVNLTWSDYPELYGEAPRFSSSFSDWLGLNFQIGLHERNLDGASANTVTRTDFFLFGNSTATPDYSITWSDPFDMWLMEQQVTAAGLDLSRLYSTVTYMGGAVMNASSDYTYWIADDTVSELWDSEWSGNIPTYTMTCSTAANGKLSILSPFTGTASAVPAHSEVYVVVTPDDGYQLKAGSLKVNGTPILGNAFVAVKNATITAEFEEAPEVNYTVSSANVDGGYVHFEKATYTQGETVTFTVSPYSNYELVSVSASSSDGTAIALSGSTTSNQWSFTMPAANVTITAVFRALASNYIYTMNTDVGTYTFTDANGNVIDIANEPVTEGTAVYVNVEMDVAYELLNVSYSVNGSNYSLTYAGEPGKYYFTMPNQPVTLFLGWTTKTAYAVSLMPTYTNGYISANASAAYPGQTVTVIATPDSGYRVANMYYYNSYGYTTYITADGNGNYSFVMPYEAVTIGCDFELIPPEAPGGTVTTAEELLAAMGGSQYATLSTFNNTVYLNANLTLTAPLEITAGQMVLDLNGYNLECALSGSTADLVTAPIQVSGTAEFSLINTSSTHSVISVADYNYTGTVEPDIDQNTVWVKGGTLHLTGYLEIQSVESTVWTGHCAAIYVTGGTAYLGNVDNRNLSVRGLGYGEALCVEGGSVTVYDGDFRTDYYMTSSEISTYGGVDEDFDPSAIVSGTVVHVSGTGSLTIEDGYFYNPAAQRAVDLAGTSGKVVINGGEYSSSMGETFYASKGDNASLDLTISKADIDYSYYDYAIQLPSGTGLKDYLAEGAIAVKNPDSDIPEVMTEEDLSARVYDFSVTIGQPLKIDIVATGNGTVTMEPAQLLPGGNLYIKPTPAFGYMVSNFYYTIEGSDYQYTVTPTSSGEYPMYLVRENRTVYVTFAEIPESQFFKVPEFSLNESVWSGSFTVPSQFTGQVNNLSWNGTFARMTLMNEDGEEVLVQECTSYPNSNVYVNFYNPANLEAGTYKMYLTMGDSSNEIDLGYQRITLSNSYTYYTYISHNLTPSSTSVDVGVTFDTLPPTLIPDDLVVEMVDQNGTVIASSADYTLEYYAHGKENTANTADSGADKGTSMMFHMNFNSTLSTDSTYSFRLRSETIRLLDRNNNTYTLHTDPMFYDKVFNPATLVWTSKVENLLPGTYSTYYYYWDPNTSQSIRYDGPNLVVTADGIATVMFSSWPFSEANSGSMNLNFTGNDGSVYSAYISYYSGSGSGSDNMWFRPAISNGVYVDYRGDSYYDYVIPSFYNDDGSYDNSQTVQVSIPGCTVSGQYTLRGLNSTTVATGTVPDLSSFTIVVPGSDAYNMTNYALDITPDDQNMGVQTITFQFRTEPALGKDVEFYGEADSGSVTLYLSHALDADEFSIGYIYLGQRIDLPFTIKDGTVVTVNTSSIPVGQWKPWATVTKNGSAGSTYESDVTIGGWSFQVYSPLDNMTGPTVQKLNPVMDENGVYTAPVLYDDEVPSGDVTMTIYRINKDTMSLFDTVVINGSGYIINSDELNLSGDYLFYFSLADGTVLDVEFANFGESNIYTVKFLDYNGVLLSEQQVERGKDATAPADPSRDGYAFTGWSASYENITRDTAVYATYKKTTFSVYFYTNEGLYTYHVADKETKLVDQPKAEPWYSGHEFLGWSTTPNGTTYWNFETDTVEADTALYACWKKLPLTISVYDDILTPSKTEAEAGETFTVTVNYDMVPAGTTLTGIRMMLDDGTSSYLALGGTYTMPNQSITLSPITEETSASLSVTINGYEDCSYVDLWLYGPDGSVYANGLNGSADFTELSAGTYYLDVTYGNDDFYNYFTEYIEVAIAAKVEHSVTLSIPTILSGTVTDAPDGWLELYDATGNYYCYGTYVNADGTYRFNNVKPGEYLLEFWGNNGYIPVDESCRYITIGEESVSNYTVTLADTADLLITLETTETENLPFQSHIVLYKDGMWFKSLSMGGEGTGYLESAIYEPGEYKLVLEYLYAPNYTLIDYESESVRFTVTEEDLASGVINKTLSYIYPTQGSASDLSGSGNMVYLDRNTAYPGELVNLTIRYQNNGSAALDNVEFQLELPISLSTFSGQNHYFVEELWPGESGSIVIPLEIEAGAAGIQSIRVDCSVNDGEFISFDSTALTVSTPVLNAPAQAKADEAFTVSGQAAPNSTVFIKDADTDLLVAVANTTGTFFSTEVIASEGTLNLVAVVKDSEARSNTVTVQVIGEEPLTVTKLFYNYCEASWSKKLNAYTFWQYVDMDLMGYDLYLELDFNYANEKIKAVELTFCGQSLDSQPNGENDTYVTPDYGFTNWGGSGLKPIYATITLEDDSVIEMIVAYVNLLIDPSGIVTDAVTGEPLEGVTVTLQVLDDETGMWMDWDGESNGAQVNPMVTDSEGKYGWMVPAGTYRVLASKEGYEDYISTAQYDNLIIPPPRDDVNISMIPVGEAKTVITELSDKGTVTANKLTAKPGETVTVTATSDIAYTLSGISVLDASGNSVKITETDKGYVFTMPNSDVTVSGLYTSKAAPVVNMTSNGEDITATAYNLNEAAALIVAQYDIDGKMLSIDFGEKNKSSVTVALVDGCTEARAFLLDGTSSMRPISSIATYPTQEK